MKIEFHPAASEEMIEASGYYEQRLPMLGRAFVQEVERVAGILQKQPRIGQRVESEFRYMLLARFPYSLIYRIEPERLWIVAVANQRRRPGYWKERGSAEQQTDGKE